MFHGSIPALITPLKNGQFDAASYQKLIEWQIASGSSAVVACGTTGESPTLSHEEWRAVVKCAVATAKGRVPVIAGTGSNDTAKSIEFTVEAQELGANAALCVVPYYNKPTQEGLYQHYKAIHDATRIPIILYTAPGRSVVTLSDEIVARLAALPRIAALKDCMEVERFVRLRKICPADFCLMTGDDGVAAAALAMGAQGCISVVANVAPTLSASLQTAWHANDMKAFAAARDNLEPLSTMLFCEANPIPVKYIASLIGLCSLEYRLPLVAPSAENQNKLRDLAQRMGLLQQKAA
jgi:4-hydroxy-tetrahydrodipicolinate synthase